MLIEVLTPEGSSTKEKGDLLESLTSEFLRTQGYEVHNEVRVTASELDLLCKHKVNGRDVYVECKAHKDNLPAGVLTKLLGTVDFHDYSEGWLVSTGPLGKDAKGFVEKWGKKEPSKREKLSIYTPERVIDALLNANLICSKPQSSASSLIQNGELSLGEWTLLISPWGKHWATPVLKAGVPTLVAVFSAEDGSFMSDTMIYENLRSTTFHLNDLEIFKQCEDGINHNVVEEESAVVEVEFGERWFDYRPARPEHFVGRKTAQRDILRFFSDTKKGRTETRIFAIKGDSGIGKSSLIAKMREVAKSSQKPNNLFLYAVDMRAANNASYVSSSLLNALNQAAKQSFGCDTKLEISNYQDPLQSESIRCFLEECSRKRELLILIFDQFEELYSKSELFAVFEEAKRLMFSTISATTNLILGFAWKTDSTVPQDHPAYHMWHQLADHRYEITLKPFSHADAKHTLRLFEQELGQSLLPELRKYLLENSQGYPWLLKKLCIHFYEQLERGTNQHQLANRSLDISSLFDQDLNNLTDNEMGCLKLVAQNAPMDWYDVLEGAGHSVVQSLQNKRLLIRRGNRLNLYWDIFRDYVLSGTVPSIPFNYIPQSPSLDALLRVIAELDDVEGKTIEDLSTRSKLKESTVRNILHDLDQFGVIAIVGNKVTVSNHLENLESRTILSSIRLLFKRHALTEKLKEHNSSKPASTEQVISYLKKVNPTAQYHIRTWTTYGNRMAMWLQVLGLAKRSREGILFCDAGDISNDNAKRWTGEGKRTVFLGDASPAKVVSALDLLKKGPKSQVSMKNLGYRNACAVLYRFRLVELTSAGEYRVHEQAMALPSIDSVWREADKEQSISAVKDFFNNTPSPSPEDVGKHVAETFSRKWKESSWKRVGNALRQWTIWLMKPIGTDGRIPEPPGRKASSDDQPSLFNFWDAEND